MSPDRWHRDLWAEAVWSSDLSPVQRLVALAYADHARDTDRAWLASSRLQQRTGLGRTAGAQAVRRLAAAGWLVPLDRPRKGLTATYRLTIPQGEKAASRPTEKATPRPMVAAEGRLATREGRLATAEGRLAAPTAVHTSELTSSLPAQAVAGGSHAASAPQAETSTIPDEDTVGGRTLAALAAQGRHDFTAGQLETAFSKAADRLGLNLAADAVMAVALLPNVRSLTGFLTGTDVDELRRLAQDHRDNRERPARPSKPAAPPKCEDPRCGPTRRLEDPDTKDDLGKCPSCHPSAQRRRGAA